MALLKIKDFDPDYREAFGGYDIKGLDVHSDVNNEKIGTINDLLVDEQGHFRYFIVDLGFWGFGKKVLLPVGRAKVDSDGKQVHAVGFTKAQAENLPEFSESLKIDNNYEEKVRGVYRTPAAGGQPIPSAAAGAVGHSVHPSDTHAAHPTHTAHTMRSVEMSAPLEGPYTPATPARPATPPPSPPSPQVGYSPEPSYPYPGNYPTSGQGHSPGQVPPPVPQVQQQVPQVPPPVPTQAPPQAPSSVQAGYPVADHPNAAYYNYQQEPSLYGMDEKNHSVLQRYEERLLAKRRQS
jgi:stress response protein YsnF